MKRVLIFSLAYHPFVGGAEVAIKEMTDRIHPSEFEFDLITLRFDEALPVVEKLGNVTVHRIGFATRAPRVSDRALPWKLRLAKILFPFTAFLKARSLHASRPYDIVWVMMANQAGFAALFFAYWYPHVPYLLELQDGNSLREVRARRPFVKLLWPLYKRIYLRADAIKVISRFIERLARDVGYHGPISVIPNGVDVARFAAPISAEESAALKARLGKKMGDIFLFTASRLVLSRGVEDVIRSLPTLPANVKFLIAGDGEDRNALEAIARECGVGERVIFAGQIGHGELPLYFKVSDIFVRPSLIEGMGNAFIEAFASRIPVVATPVGGIPDFLTDPETDPDMEPTGIFCKVRDPESIAKAVRRYIDDPVLTERIVRNASQLAESAYDWDMIADEMRRKILIPLTNR